MIPQSQTKLTINIQVEKMNIILHSKSVGQSDRLDLQEPIDPGAPCRGFLKGITF